MADLRRMSTQVASVRTVRVDHTVARCLPDRILNPGAPPNYLYAAGKPGRFNTAGVNCVYFGEDENTARAEYASHLPSGMDIYQPLATYWAQARLARVLDLSDGGVLAHLGLNDADLYATWTGVSIPTATQILGKMVAGTTGSGRISAIRFPSEAMRRAGKTGFNFVIFRDCVIGSDQLRILGPGGAPLQEWP